MKKKKKDMRNNSQVKQEARKKGEKKQKEQKKGKKVVTQWKSHSPLFFNLFIFE